MPRRGSRTPSGDPNVFQDQGKILSDEIHSPGTPRKSLTEAAIDHLTAVSSVEPDSPPTIRLMRRALDMIGSPDRLTRWMQTPLPALHGRTPYELIDSDTGRQEIAQALDRLDFGVY